MASISLMPGLSARKTRRKALEMLVEANSKEAS
jgi:hypothetical protein